jgi:hypothetical protein
MTLMSFLSDATLRVAAPAVGDWQSDDVFGRRRHFRAKQPVESHSGSPCTLRGPSPIFFSLSPCLSSNVDGRAR